MTVERTETVTVTEEETKELTTEEREALARKMGITVPLGLRSTTARKAYLNMRQVPTTKTVKVKKQKKRTFKEVIEKTLPRKTTVNAIASGGYNYATNTNQADIDIIADSIDSQNANLLILVPAGRTEDTVAFLLGPSAVRYATLDTSSFDALNGNITYTRLLGRKQTAPGLATGGTARTDLLTMGLDGTSVLEPGFGAEQISIATPSIGWSRSNIGFGTKLCGEKGAEAYCYYANFSVSLRESLADIETQTSTQAVIETTIGWHPPVKNLSVSATGSVQGVAFADYPGGRQDVVLIGSGSLNWTPSEKLSFSAGVSFTQQLSTQSDLDWNGWNAYPQAVLNLKFC